MDKKEICSSDNDINRRNFIKKICLTGIYLTHFKILNSTTLATALISCAGTEYEADLCIPDIGNIDNCQGTQYDPDECNPASQDTCSATQYDPDECHPPDDEDTCSTSEYDPDECNPPSSTNDICSSEMVGGDECHPEADDPDTCHGNATDPDECNPVSQDTCSATQYDPDECHPPDDSDSCGGVQYDPDEDEPLCVNISSFELIFINKTILLKWTTQNEVGNVGFEIIRANKKNGKYKLISSYSSNKNLIGAGNSFSVHNYNFIDKDINIGNTYWYKLVSIDTAGEKDFFGPIFIETIDSENLKGFELFQNYPNPFNASTVISYQIPQKSFVILKILDILGKEVVTLVNKEQPAGYYEYILSTENVGLTSGVYIYQLVAGNYKKSRKMILKK